MENYENLKTLVEELTGDVDKFYANGNKAAGTRVRQSLQQIKKVAQDMRLEISASKKA